MSAPALTCTAGRGGRAVMVYRETRTFMMSCSSYDTSRDIPRGSVESREGPSSSLKASNPVDRKYIDNRLSEIYYIFFSLFKHFVFTHIVFMPLFH